MKKFFGLLAITISIIVVTFFTSIKEVPAKRHEVAAPITVPITNIARQIKQDKITAHGTVQPRWQTTLTSEVNGRVLNISEQLLEGARFEKGAPLINIENSQYKAALAKAESDLATTERQLLEEQKRAAIALENWQASGIEGEASELTLRIPQLKELKAAVASAKAEVQRTQYDLSQTKVKAPYTGVAIERMVNPGSTLQVGSEVAKIYDNRIYEISLALNNNQFARLPKQPIKTRVLISDTYSEKYWQGIIIRLDQRFDETNRWRNVHIEITETEGLLPGQFVTVDIPGKTYKDTLSIPEKLIGSDGKIWFVDNNDYLQYFQADILFYDNENAIVKAPENISVPLSATANRDIYLPGTTVTPFMQENDIAAYAQVTN